jgi:2-amino-4-hydroxy-6-hydroxymethyldihydropteridine diphosphokinase
MAQALVGLGSNIEPRRDYLKLALESLDQGPCSLLMKSGLYETEPMDVKDQAPFLNMAVRLATDLKPQALLEFLQSIEAKAHKKVLVRRGPRTLDLDLWAYGQEVVESPSLSLPHPKIAERPFVLVPLREIAPEWQHPLNGLNAQQMLDLIPKPWPEIMGLGVL